MKTPRALSATLILSLALLAAPVQADPRADAETIIGATVTETMVRGMLEPMMPLIVGSFENEIGKAGITLSDPDAFFAILIDEFMAGFLVEMEARMVDLYVDTYTPEELAGIATFMDSDAGKAMLNNAAALSQQGALIGQIAGMKAGAAASDRVVARLQSEGITLTSDPSKQAELEALLKGMGAGN